MLDKIKAYYEKFISDYLSKIDLRSCLAKKRKRHCGLDPQSQNLAILNQVQDDEKKVLTKQLLTFLKKILEKANFEKLLEKTNLIKNIAIGIIFLLLIIIFFFIHKLLLSSFNNTDNKAQEASDAGKIAVELEQYKKIVRTNPMNYKAHIKLGELFLEVKEQEQAKVEFYRAVKSAPTGDYEAIFELADLYLDQDEVELAEDLVHQVPDNKKIYTNNHKGEFYLKLASKIASQNPSEACRTLKKTFEYLDLSTSKELLSTKHLLTKTTLTIAEKLTYENDNDNAIMLLKMCITFNDVPELHSKLGKIYQKKGDLLSSLNHYKTAYDQFESETTKKSYITILMELAREAESKKDKIKVKYYYYLVKQLDPKANIPYYVDANILLNIISTNFAENNSMENSIIPGISFTITNVNKEKIAYLTAKIVFLHNDKILSEVKKSLATKQNPLPTSLISPTITVFSINPAYNYNAGDDITIRIYLSQEKPDEWVLYRNSYIKKKQDNNG